MSIVSRGDDLIMCPDSVDVQCVALSAHIDSIQSIVTLGDAPPSFSFSASA